MSASAVIVTGANKGIGLCIVKQLVAAGVPAVLTARDIALGEAAAREIGSPLVTTRQLDISSAASISSFASWVAETYPAGIAALINNAGIAYKGATFGADEAQVTLDTNLFGTYDLSTALLGSMPAGCRVVNVASRAGRLGQLSAELQAAFTSDALTMETLRGLVSTFVGAIRDDTYAAKGWPKSMYGVSKCAEIAMTRVFARAHPHLLVAACCPGWCKTDMSSNQGPRSADEGADTPVWLAALAPRETFGVEAGSALFFADRAVVDW